ncbi:hypothetical protein AVEN_12267-1 [Araneus ventricosus]|uniref:FAS1 domain-containing protein n=1 Tax=Araneus ventricosus TaxID=182803 RepID=A0A4Y2PXT1_ARAVE|nr:hypothetical protein AVEN_12267-1 [Araneus ventricosus]
MRRDCFQYASKTRRPKCLLPYKTSPPELVFGKLPCFRSIPSLHRHLRMRMELNKITYELAEQDGWASLLNAYEKRFTFFVPGNEAWEQLRSEMPTEYKQLTMRVFPYHVHKILDRHLVVNRELRSTDLERLKEIQMVHGNFKIIHSGYPNADAQNHGHLPEYRTERATAIFWIKPGISRMLSVETDIRVAISMSLSDWSLVQMIFHGPQIFDGKSI